MTNAMSQPLILLGLNEINFDYVQSYVNQGKLPGFKALFEKTLLIRTSSEKSYKELEPWIQWVSIQTGKDFSEHGIFRLGDMVEAGHIQIWEHLEAQGVSVGAVSPMNAANRCEDPKFFVPDPWTKTAAKGDWLMLRLAQAVADAVNENATGGSKLSSYFFVLLGLARYSLLQRPRVIAQCLRAVFTHYQRAVLLDQLLTDMFIYHWKKDRPDFSTLFLNSGAHVQHHYLFNSVCYNGANRNPDWYIKAGADPVLDAYKSYDAILRHLLNLPGKPRLLVVTGLHQTPVERPVFYWRLKDHRAFLNLLGVAHKNVQPRMSRDFLIECADERSCAMAEFMLRSCRDKNGKPLFEEMENRGKSLFVTLTYPESIGNDFVLRYANGEISNFLDMIGFVALKNGEHDGEGYLVDTQGALNPAQTFPITGIFKLIEGHFSTQAKMKKAA